MKISKALLFLVSTLFLANCGEANIEETETTTVAETSREYYQLKIYSFEDQDQVATTDKYLRDAYLPALKKQGIEPVGVFKLKPSETDSSLKTYVLIPFDELEQVVEIENALSADEGYQTAGSDYLQASYQKPPYSRMESILMQAFTDMPEMAATSLDGPRAERVYELRSYESPTERYYRSKVDMFNAGGEVKLFDRLGFNAVFYAEVLSGAKMPNLMYMTTFPDMPTRDTLWKAFFGSPEWKELLTVEKYKNSVSHADIIFLYPTEYSAY